MIENLIEGVGSDTQAQLAERSSQLGRDEFLRMLVTQLENQDPLNPQDATEFTAQLAQFSTLEQLISIRDGIETLVSKGNEDAASGASDLTADLLATSLIGKRVFARGSEFQLLGSGASGAESGSGAAAAGSRDLPRLSFDLEGNASEVSVAVLGPTGDEVARIEVGRRNQGRVDLSAEQTREALSELPPGTYRYRVDARLGEEPVGSLPYVGARVTGSSLAGETPLLMMGDVQIPVSDVIEVREVDG